MSGHFAVEAVFCDLDGTLVDSAPDLAAAADATLADLGLPPRGEEAVRGWVGNGVERLLHRALTNDHHGQAPAALFEHAKQCFWGHYQRGLCVHSRLYPGVQEGLLALAQQGFRLACVTNKPVDFARPLLKALGVDQLFSVVLGGDSVPQKKPAPDILLTAATQLGAGIQTSLLVGDSVTDVQTARNAGCPVVCVPYGYNHGQPIHQAQPDAVIDSLAALPDLLRSVA